MVRLQRPALPNNIQMKVPTKAEPPSLDRLESTASEHLEDTCGVW